MTDNDRPDAAVALTPFVWAPPAVMWAASAAVYARLPESVPFHWNAAGEVDEVVGPVVATVALPAVATALAVLMYVSPRFDPGRANYASFAGAYRAVSLAVGAVLLLIHAAILANGLGYEVAVPRLAVVAIGGVLVTAGISMGKLRPNWFIGIRTPWTLSSKQSWDRTHRLAGRLFVAAGGLAVATGLTGPLELASVCLLAGGLGAALASGAYSFWVWREADDVVPPTGTSPAS